MKQRINKMPIISWFKKKCIPDYADIISVNLPNKEELNKDLKTQINGMMNFDDGSLPIRIITKPFAEAMADTVPQFTKDVKIWTSLENYVVYSGVILANEIIYYCFSKRPEAYDYDIFVAVFDKDRTLLSLRKQISGQKSQSFISSLHLYKMKEFMEIVGDVSQKDIAVRVETYYYQLVILFELFRKYAKVETRILQPKSKAELFKCKYHNDNDYSIEIMDSTWFTTLVKSDEFKVRGHFRLQPCGQAFAERKLVWIKDFTKEGYTRKAKKELEIA
jgi:hypothetical protein